MRKCIVIGGGLAGISAAINLSQNDCQVELIEASPKLGGRTYSFQEKFTKDEIDNGQHILMGLYDNTFEMLDLIESKSGLLFQKNLQIEFLKNGKIYDLTSSNVPYPFNLLGALFGFKAFTLKEKFNSIYFLLKVYLKSGRNLEGINALSWLKNNNQSTNSIKSLWEILCISALNTTLKECSAKVFKLVLKRIFFTGNTSARMVLTNLPLDKIFIEPSINYFKKAGISFTTSEALSEIRTSNNKAFELITNKRTLTDFDSIILAIPPNSLTKINNNSNILDSSLLELETSPIITIHIWEKNKTLHKPFLGILDSPIHWVFNNKTHLSVVISGADEFISLDSSKIIDLVALELSKNVKNFTAENITHYRVLKEKRATLKCNFENEQRRQSIQSNIENIEIAGDWVNTGLPGTIEGAVLSGILASSNIISKKNP